MKREKSFTLIELLVVIGLVSLISGAVMSIYFSSIQAQREILETQELLSQINYAFEYMARFIMLAKVDDLEDPQHVEVNCCNDYAVNYCLLSPSEILFRNSKNECQKFYLLNNEIYEEIVGTSTFPLTSKSGAKITNLRFKVSGASRDDQEQPRVTILIEVQKRNGKKLYFQTTISQRNLDVR